MASLDEITSHLKIESQNQTVKTGSKSSIGQKRRPWLAAPEEESQHQTKGVYKPDSEKGIINPIDQPLLSTPLINPIDQPHYDKGFIKGGHAPLSLSLENLRGNPLKLVYFLSELIRSGADQVTPKITQTDIMRALEISKDSAKTATRFLLKNKLIERVNFKIGKKGWSQYSMKNSLVKEIENAIENGSIPLAVAEKGVKVDQKGFISSSSYINNNKNTTTTTSKPVNNNDWLALDIDPLAEIGFTKTHLEQIAQQGKLSTEIVQDSINAFAYDLMHNKKAAEIKGSHLNYFMGILRNGRPYVPPPNYESPQDREMRIYLERKQEMKNKRAEREEELIKLAFEEWEREQSEEAKQELLPPDIRNAPYPGLKKSTLRAYFAKEIWPQKRKELQF